MPPRPYDAHVRTHENVPLMQTVYYIHANPVHLTRSWMCIQDLYSEHLIVNLSTFRSTHCTLYTFEVQLELQLQLYLEFRSSVLTRVHVSLKCETHRDTWYVYCRVRVLVVTRSVKFGEVFTNVGILYCFRTNGIMSRTDRRRESSPLVYLGQAGSGPATRARPSELGSLE